jgi:hypothetical protein
LALRVEMQDNNERGVDVVGILSKNICRARTPPADVPMPTVGKRFPAAF